MITVVRFADSDCEFCRAGCADGLKLRPLVASRYHNGDAVLGEVIRLTTDRICPVRRKVCCDREIQDLDAEFTEALARIDDLVHIPISAYAILRNYHVRSRSDTSDQPDDACLVSNGVTDIGAYEAERVDRVIVKVGVCQVDACANNADPDSFPCQAEPP